MTTVKTHSKVGKRILSVTIKHMCDESPDTSWLGEYSDRPTSEFAIDRAHSEDCASVNEQAKAAKLTLEHAQQTVGDLCNDSTCGEEEHEGYDAAYDDLEHKMEEVIECDCNKHYNNREFRYFNGPVENYLGESPEDIRKYVRQGYECMERLNAGDWYFIGIQAEAKIGIGDVANYPKKYDVTTQKISSGGLWGIKSDSDKSYFAEVEGNELSELKSQLEVLGFSKRAIATAFKTIEHKDE